MEIKFKPLNGKVLLAKDEVAQEEAKTTTCGIILPTKETEKNLNVAYVVAICDDCIVKVGDRVRYTPYDFTTIKLDDKEYYIIDQKYLLGVLL